MSELALKLIAENKASRNPFLDLGKCGLTELPQELEELTHLEFLNLSEDYYRWNEEKQEDELIKSQNQGEGNILSDILVLSSLINLKVLYCRSGRNNEQMWNIKDISPLRNLSKLEVLFISKNQIQDISPLTSLTNLQELSLHENQIKDISPLTNLANLQQLWLYHNQIQDISPLTSLTNLQNLSLSENQIQDISPLTSLTNVQYLYLSQNQIQDISPLTNLTNVQTLRLHENQIQDISPLTSLTSLQKLWLSHNQIQDISPLTSLTNLQRLWLSHNQIQDISPLTSLTNVQTLRLHENQIQDISPLTSLTSLQELWLSHNQIQDISPLTSLTNLQRLWLYQNQIQDISSLTSLTNLQYLSLHQNQIQDISPLRSLTNLQTLGLHQNQIQDIAPLRSLTNLQELSLSQNQIQDISPLTSLTNLQILFLHQNYIQDISPLTSLTNLQQLWLHQNQIQDIFPLTSLTNLQTLGLDQNQIQDISPLRSLTNLQELSLSQNQIQDISPLTRLTNLQRLWLYQNQIQDISPLLPLYKKVSDIYISYNPLLHPPLEVVNRGKSSVIAYLEALARGETLQFLHEAKVVIIGEGGTGKTSLLNKMKDLNNELPAVEQRTRGIEVAPLHFTDREGNDFQMNIWDFGGQGIYQATHQFFLSKRSLYILLDDTRRSDSTLQDPTFNYWLQVSELYGGGSPLLILQNEKEDFSKTINFADMQQRFPFIKALYASNLKKTNKDWNRLQHDIKEFLSQLPHIGTWMRKEWIDIRKILIEKAEKRDYISWEDYEEVCQENGIKEETEMLLLSGLLHDLGTILHFQDNSLLKQRLILKKEWATEAIYKVLDCEIIKQEKKGQFTEVDLERIWKDKKWKNSLPQLLALMAEFEICYALEDKKPKTYLAPLLLPAETPQYEWEKQGNLVLRYKYRFMPQGMLSRLIVRLHRYVKDTEKAWKTGVILSNEEGTMAEVRDIYGESEIRIVIQGKDKKEFMHIIRTELDALNATFPFQDFPDRAKAVQKLVPCVCETCQKANIPHYYEYDDLKRREEKKKKTAECKMSYEDVPVKNILDAVLYSEKETLVKELRGLIAKGKEEDALLLLQKYEETHAKDEVLMLSSRFSHLKRDLLRLGKDDIIEKSKITSSVIEVINTLEREED